MRPPVDAARIRDLAVGLSRVARRPVRIYLTGGATAVVEGWRESTIDVDLRIEPDDDELYSQALSKVERGFEHDLADVGHMLEAGLVERDRLRTLYEAIETELYRYPALDPASFRRKLDSALRS